MRLPRLPGPALPAAHRRGGPRVPCRRLLPLVVLALALTGTGCETMRDGQTVVDRAALVNDLATRLENSRELTYSAQYQLAGGSTASIVQDQTPRRTAYTHPGGMVTVTADATTDCRVSRNSTTCTVTPPPSPAAGPPAVVLEAATAHGMITPAAVIGLLTAAALDAEAGIEQYDTSVAGQHASCVTVSRVKNAPATGFDTCVTTDGILGSFSAVYDGTPVDVSLTRYQTTADPAAFAVPSDATVVDRRPGRR